MFKGRKPLVRSRMSQTAVIGSSHAMHALVFLSWQECVSKLANLRMHGIEPPVKLQERGIDQFITCDTPVLLELWRDDRSGWKRDFLSFSVHIFQVMFTFEPHG